MVNTVTACCGYNQSLLRCGIYMGYPLVCISKALHRGIICVVIANSYGLLWL